MGSYKYSENEVSWSLFAIGFEWIMSENRLSSLANTRSSKFGVCPSLLLVVLETIWVRKASLTHCTNMLSLMPDHSQSHLTVGKLKSPTIYALSKVFTGSFSVRLHSSWLLASVELGLLYVHPTKNPLTTYICKVTPHTPLKVSYIKFFTF